MKNLQHSIIYYLNWILIGLVIGVVVLFLQGRLLITGDNLDQKQGLNASSFAEAVSRVSPSVVNIQIARQPEQEAAPSNNRLLDLFLNKHSTQPWTRPEIRSGSGVILNPDGYILTNYHVIADARAIRVTLNDGRAATASLVGNDPDTDLAVLKIELKDLPQVQRADIKQVKTGDIVLAIGYPYEIGQAVTLGIISATGRTHVSSNTYENFLQTDAAINPGNSGGALINTKGEIVGINSLIFSNTGGFQGIGFAIPIDLAQMVLEQIVQNGYVVRGWLGVEGVDIPRALLNKIGLTDVKGILITGVDTDGPGDEAGIQVGDIITHINNEPQGSVKAILNKIADGKPGDTFEISGIRDRQSFMTEATLGQRPVMSNEKQ